jgi:hypothetical protein
MIGCPIRNRLRRGKGNNLRLPGFPAALDLAVEHLGKNPDIYITTEKRYFPKLKRLAEKSAPGKYEVREDDYLVFHHGGYYEVLTGELTKDDALGISFRI